MLSKNIQKHTRLFGFLVVIILFSFKVIHAQDIRGCVTDEKHKPIQGAIVKLYRDGVQRNRASTNKKGYYHIWPIEPGGYQAFVDVQGYDRIIHDIDKKTRETDTFNFELRKKSGLLAQ